MNREVRLAGSLCAFAVETETVGNDRNRRQIIRNGKRRRISADTSSLFLFFWSENNTLYFHFLLCRACHRQGLGEEFYTSGKMTKGKRRSIL
jgi:hypothetical protein